MEEIVMLNRLYNFIQIYEIICRSWSVTLDVCTSTLFNQSCTNNSECQNIADLACLNGYCLCNTTKKLEFKLK